MPDLSEFSGFVSEKSGVKNTFLVEKDILLHRILWEISSHFGRAILFKGGSCLVKCYFGYYRFSVDLDFTWKDQNMWNNLSKREFQNKLRDKVNEFALIVEKISKKLNLDFKNDHSNSKYFEFGGGKKITTFKLWKGEKLIKIQVNFLERIIFEGKFKTARTLLKNRISEDEKIYFEDFLKFYRPFELLCYDEREILCEKIRAILTRRGQKLRDFYDIFVLEKNGFSVEENIKEIIEKVRFSLERYEKYRRNFEKNRKSLDFSIIDNPFERSLFLTKPGKEFEIFLKNFQSVLREIITEHFT